MNNKDYSGFLMMLSKSDVKPIKAEGMNANGSESSVVCSLFERQGGCSIVRPRPDLFQSVVSSSNNVNKPYLRCYRGMQEGVLYPLACGLLFIKPMMYVDIDDIAVLSAGRGGASSYTRFIDLEVILFPDLLMYLFV